MSDLILRNRAINTNISVAPAFYGSLPVTNLSQPAVGRVARSIGAGQHIIDINMFPSRPAASDGLALFGDFSPQASARVQVYSGIAGTGTLLHDSGVLSLLPQSDLLPYGQIHNFPPPFFYNRFNPLAVGNYLCVLITLSDPAPPLGFHQLYRLVIGEVFSPRVGTTYARPWVYTLEDSGSTERNDAGDLNALRGRVKRRFQVPLEISETERRALVESWRYCGNTKEVFVHLAPDTPQSFMRLELGMCGTLTDTLSLTPISYNRHGVTLTLLESLVSMACLRVVAGMD